MKVVCQTLLVWLLLSAAILADAGENLSSNPGFEDASGAAGDIPDGWVWFASEDQSVGIDEEISRSGSRSVKISAQRARDAQGGIFQELTVDPLREYTFAAYVLNDEAGPLGQWSSGMIGIEWKKADDSDISRVKSEAWNWQLSGRRWERYFVKAKAPSRAAKARFVIYLYDGPLPSTGSFFVDDVEVTVD